MGQFELNEGLAAKGPKLGEVRNPTGANNLLLRFKNRHIRKLLRMVGDEPCPEPGFEHLTNEEFMVRVAWAKAKAGEKWFVNYITTRLYGRVPLQVEMDVRQELPDFSELTEQELAVRVDRIRALLLEPRPAPEVKDISD